MYSIKFSYKEEVRRVQLANQSNEHYSFSQLSTTVKNLYPEIKNKKVSLIYKDEENDLITVTTDEELAESIRVMGAGSTKLLRYTVKITDEVDVPVAVAENVDLKPSKILVHHIGVRCDECGMVPIAGTRYKCTVREDFDLCSACEASKTQPYPMIKIEDPSHAPEALVYAFKDKNVAANLPPRFGTVPGRGYGGRGFPGRGGPFSGRCGAPPPGFHHGPQHPHAPQPGAFFGHPAGPPPPGPQGPWFPVGGPHHPSFHGHGPHGHGHGHGHHHDHGKFHHMWAGDRYTGWVPPSAGSVHADPNPPKEGEQITEQQPRSDKLRAEAAPFIRGMDAAALSQGSSVNGTNSSRYTSVDMPVCELQSLLDSVTANHRSSGDTASINFIAEDEDSDSEMQRAIRESFADMAAAAPSAASAKTVSAGVNCDQVNGTEDEQYDEDKMLAAAIEATAPLVESHFQPDQQQLVGASSFMSPGTSQMMGISSLTNSFASGVGNNSLNFVFPAGTATVPGPLSASVSVSSLPKKLEMRFVRDVTYANGTLVPAGAVFRKIWRIRNDGLYDYPPNVTLAYAGGDVLGDVTLHECVPELKVGEEGEVSTTLTAPEHAGRYVSFFRVETNDEVKFGQRLYANIQVIDEESEWHLVNGTGLSATGDDSSTVGQDNTNDNTQDCSVTGDEQDNEEPDLAAIHEQLASLEVVIDQRHELERLEALQQQQEQSGASAAAANESCDLAASDYLVASTLSASTTSTERPSDIFYACKEGKTLPKDTKVDNDSHDDSSFKSVGSHNGMADASSAGSEDDDEDINDTLAASMTLPARGVVAAVMTESTIDATDKDSIAKDDTEVAPSPPAAVTDNIVIVEDVEEGDDEEEESEFAAEIAQINAAHAAAEAAERERVAAEQARRAHEEEMRVYVAKAREAEKERAAQNARRVQEDKTARENAERLAAEQTRRLAEAAALAAEAVRAAEAERVRVAELAALRAREAAASTNPFGPNSTTANSDSYTNSVAVLWRRELQLLNEMGFDDVDVLIPLLQTHMGTPSSLSGDSGETNVEGMQRVVATLLNSFGMLR